jgi:hypothetical protein
MSKHNPGLTPISIEERFWTKVVKGDEDACWEWLGYKDYRGYGSLWDNSLGRNIFAHRVAYFIKHGKYPDNYACHTCDNPPCVNPNHIFDGTPFDNTMDMMAKGRQVNQYRNREACSAGHTYTDESTYISRQGVRVCRICRRRRLKIHKENKLRNIAEN